LTRLHVKRAKIGGYKVQIARPDSCAPVVLYDTALCLLKGRGVLNTAKVLLYKHQVNKK